MKKLNKQEIVDRLCQYDVYLMMKNINNEDYSWLADIRETGAECQISFFFIQQKYKDHVKPLSKYYGASK